MTGTLTDLEAQAGARAHLEWPQAMELLTSELGYGYAADTAVTVMERALDAGICTSARVRVRNRPAGWLVTRVYSDARGRYYEAVPYGAYPVASWPASADWSVHVTTRDANALEVPTAGQLAGFIVDQRCDVAGFSSEFRAADDAPPAYEAYRPVSGPRAYLGECQSIAGALHRIAADYGSRRR